MKILNSNREFQRHSFYEIFPARSRGPHRGEQHREILDFGSDRLGAWPDRLNRRLPVDEHDFYQGKYLAVAAEGTPEGCSAAGERIRDHR